MASNVNRKRLHKKCQIKHHRNFCPIDIGKQELPTATHNYPHALVDEAIAKAVNHQG